MIEPEEPYLPRELWDADTGAELPPGTLEFAGIDGDVYRIQIGRITPRRARRSGRPACLWRPSNGAR